MSYDDPDVYWYQLPTDLKAELLSYLTPEELAESWPEDNTTPTYPQDATDEATTSVITINGDYALEAPSSELVDTWHETLSSYYPNKVVVNSEIDAPIVSITVQEAVDESWTRSLVDPYDASVAYC